MTLPVSLLSSSGRSNTSGSVANTLVGWITTPCLFFVWNTYTMLKQNDIQYLNMLCWIYCMNWDGCCIRADLVRVLAGGVVFIWQCHLRVEASAEQQLEQSLLSGGQVLTDADRFLQLWHVVTQLELHLLFNREESNRYVTQDVSASNIHDNILSNAHANSSVKGVEIAGTLISY